MDVFDIFRRQRCAKRWTAKPGAKVAVIPNPVTDPPAGVKTALLNAVAAAGGPAANAVAGVKATAGNTGTETPLRFRCDTAGVTPCILVEERQGSASLR